MNKLNHSNLCVTYSFNINYLTCQIALPVQLFQSSASGIEALHLHNVLLVFCKRNLIRNKYLNQFHSSLYDTVNTPFNSALSSVQYCFNKHGMDSQQHKNNYQIKMEPVPDQANKKADSKHSPELDQPGDHRPELSADYGYNNKNNQRNL